MNPNLTQAEQALADLHLADIRENIEIDRYIQRENFVLFLVGAARKAEAMDRLEKALAWQR